jgi:voltage-gated potassium channel
MWKERFAAVCREWYLGDSERSLRFRMALLAFDLLTIVFFVVSSMFDPHWFIYAIDYVIALMMAVDLYARSTFAVHKKKWWLSFATGLDICVILSLLASMVTDNLSFLRIIRTLRLLRSYHVLRDLKDHYPWFRAHQDTIESSFNLFVFVFFTAACVFVTENNENDQINNYLDALYFTVTTLTTTGFGDITLKDDMGRMLSIIIMVVGVSLFLRLVQTIFRPHRVRFPCPDCGLALHDPDAVHCKHCGRVLNIPNDGF